MDIGPEIFADEMTDLDMEFEKFFLANSNQKVIFASPDPQAGLPREQLKVMDVSNYLVEGPQEFIDQFEAEVYPKLNTLSDKNPSLELKFTEGEGK